MPTVPPAQPASPQPADPQPSQQSHHARAVAESFGAEASRYDRARPSYPSALVDRIVAASPGRDVLDVGCGTGIVARQFQAAGCTVLGVDPDPRMAAQARDRGLEVEVAKFETWETNGRSFHAVVTGQAWHWVDPVAGAAKAASALRPGGRFAVFWNVFQPPADVAHAIGEAYRQVLPEAPAGVWGRPMLDIYQVMAARTTDGMRQAGAFGEPEQWQFGWERPYTRVEWLEQVPTFGGFSRIPPDKQQELLRAIGAAVDAAGGGFTMGYTTLAVTAALTRSGRPPAA